MRNIQSLKPRCANVYKKLRNILFRKKRANFREISQTGRVLQGSRDTIADVIPSDSQDTTDEIATLTSPTHRIPLGPTTKDKESTSKSYKSWNNKSNYRQKPATGALKGDHPKNKRKCHGHLFGGHDVHQAPRSRTSMTSHHHSFRKPQGSLDQTRSSSSYTSNYYFLLKAIK